MERLTRRELAGRAAAAGVAIALPPGLGRVPPTAAWLAARDPIRELAREVRGPVLRPRDSSGLVYDERWWARRPRAAVQALDTADVQAVVRWSARTGIPIAVRSGGHSYGGWSTIEGGVVLDLRRLRGVSVRGGHATAGPGTRLIDLYAALAPRGARVPAGTCPTVALGGLALGGGMGLAGRQLGLTCDRVAALRLVTADGRARTVDARSEPDLYWACRGGGGSFGVATAYTLRLSAARPAAWFSIRWPTGSAAEALAAWEAWAPHTDPRMTSVLSLARGSVGAIGQLDGSEAQLRALVRPLRAVSGATLRAGTSGYLALMRRWAGCPEAGACTSPPTRFAAASAYVARPLRSAGRAALVGWVRRGPGVLLLDAYGGAINRPAADETAFAHRDALFSVQALIYFDAGGAHAALARLRDARRTLAPHSNGEAYQNYADPELHDWRRAYYAGNLARLEQIKARVDPGRLFDFPQAI